MASSVIAYLDPGTGSLIVQAVIGAVLGCALVFKTFWINLIGRLKRGLRHDPPTE